LICPAGLANVPAQFGAVNPDYLAMHRLPLKIHVPAVLRGCCDGASELILAAASVRGALEELERSHPSLYRSICDETGKVRRHVNLFVNASHVRDREGLDTALAPGDVITILPAVSGG
jgi:sulfur-carrier protein